MDTPPRPSARQRRTRHAPDLVGRAAGLTLALTGVASVAAAIMTAGG